MFQKQLSSTSVSTLIINQYIRVISEDDVTLSNDAENSALLHRNKLYFKVYKTGTQY